MAYISTYRTTMFAVLLALVATSVTAEEAAVMPAVTPPFVLHSPAFTNGGQIPVEYTCEGQDLVPPLSWTGIPKGTRTLALIIEDPDVPDPAAPKRTWVHWVVFGIPPGTDGLSQGRPEQGPPPGAKQGLNDWNREAYGGPCPPVGRHRYFHTLYALDVELESLGHPTKIELEKAMHGHVLAKAVLMATYEKTKRGKTGR